jgi:zona occludens toxin (predicted ATPase)
VRRKRNQRIGVLIGALALAAALIGSRLAFQDAPTSASAQNAPRTSSAPAPSSAAVAATTAPSTSSAAAPAMTMACPANGGATTVFGHEITVPAPYKITIRYGDGDSYTNDDAHLGAIFSHTYKKAGTYAVDAVLTAPGGGTATANCTYTWGP